MKKFIIAIFALVYLGTTTGATVHMHYCMGKLAGWSFSHQENDKCAKCGMQKMGDEQNDCCNDELQFLKNNNDQKSTNAFQLLPVTQSVILVSFFSFVTTEPPAADLETLNSHAPPPGSGVDIYKRNCVFRL